MTDEPTRPGSRPRDPRGGSPTPLYWSTRVPPTRVTVAGVTDVGRARDNNEDGFLLWNLESDTEIAEVFETGCTERRPLLLLAVSDGMGGQLAGEVASATALATLADFVRAGAAGLADRASEGIGTWLERGVQEAHQRVRERSEEDAETHGMGATLSVSLLLGQRMCLAHVGDSRVYLFREGRLRQLTMDHTHVQDLVAHGHLSVEQARVHQERNLLMQAIGVSESVAADVSEVAVNRGDRLLLSSDGLHDLVPDDEIAEVFEANGTPRGDCRELISRANDYGGPDNITAVVAHFD